MRAIPNLGGRVVAAIIGGTGLDRWPGLDVIEAIPVETPYGDLASPLLHGRIDELEVVFLARHGEKHAVPPHRINARANLWALHAVGVPRIFAVSSVGGIAPWMGPACVAVPDDVIDYTWGRQHTFFDGEIGALTEAHVDMTESYAAHGRRALLAAAAQTGIDCHDGGVMGITQGPRLETPAEVRRLRNDGCDMVNMTGMPEVALAREIGLEYATLAVSINWAAGLGHGAGIHDEIAESIRIGMHRVQTILGAALKV